MMCVCKIAAVLVVSVAISLAVRCGSLSDPLASDGGSGAGNPGGMVAFSMHAGIEGPMDDSSAVPSRSIDSIDSAAPITVTDRAGLKIRISSVSITNISVLFSLDSSEKPSPLLKSMKHHSPDLSTDTHNIVLSGPHLFNALDGDVDSSIRTLFLPVARYTGVGLYFKRDTFPSLRGQIVMNGSFTYNGTERKLVVDLFNSSKFSYHRLYRFKGGIFTLSHTDTTNLRLQFDAKQWFSAIDIVALLKTGHLSFSQSTGELLITNRGPFCAAWWANFIFENVVQCGRLVVY